MTQRVVFRPEAQGEVLETRRWYEERREGLEAEFASAVDAMVERIMTSPLAFPCAHGETRRAVVRRFPYAMYFRVLADGAIVVLAVHGRQHASRWQTPFELLFALLRRLDSDPDGVVFFADEGGSWQVGVDWRAALPAYFRCLADGTSAEDFAREVNHAIADFADYERPKHLAAARRAANAEQRAALRALHAREHDRS